MKNSKTDDSSATLKGLQVKERTLIEDNRLLRKLDITPETTKKINDNSKEIENTRRLIKEMTKDDVFISEHALLRFIERAQLLNLDNIRKALLSDNIKKQIKAFGDGKYTYKGYILIVDNGVVVTVEYADDNPLKKKMIYEDSSNS